MHTTLTHVYSVSQSHYGPRYTKVRILRQTKSRIETAFEREDGSLGSIDTYSLRSYGEWEIMGETGSWRRTHLELDVAKVKRILAERKARQHFQRTASDVQQAIEEEIRKHKNGFGDYCGGEEGLARMQQALAILRGEDDVH